MTKTSADIRAPLRSLHLGAGDIRRAPCTLAMDHAEVRASPGGLHLDATAIRRFCCTGIPAAGEVTQPAVRVDLRFPDE